MVIIGMIFGIVGFFLGLVVGLLTVCWMTSGKMADIYCNGVIWGASHADQLQLDEADRINEELREVVEGVL